MMDQVARYAPALRHVPAAGGDVRVLEVGSGTRGACHHASGTFFGADLHFSDYLEVAPRLHGRLLAVRADAMRLPFADRTFDCVLSLDLLEHLAPEDRATAVREMQRVAARRVVVGCPVGDSWDRWELRLQRFYGLLGKKVPGWLVEHRERGLPSRDDLEGFPDPSGWSSTARGNVNAAVNFLLLAVEATPLGWVTSWLLGEAGPSGPGLLARAFGRTMEWMSFGGTARTILVLDREAE